MDSSDIRLIKSHRDSYLPAIRLYSKRVSISHLLPKLSRFINKLLYDFGVGTALNRYDNSFTAYSSAADRKLYRKYSATDIFCNFGSGAFFHKKWRNYDYPGQSNYYANLQGIKGVHYAPIDLCAAELYIPENDSSVALIYSGHTLEHLEADAATNFLRECHRILKPGGIIRLALPNTTNNFHFNRYLDMGKGTNDNLRTQYQREAATYMLADTKNLSGKDINSLFLKSNAEPKLFYDLAAEHVSIKFDGSNPDRHITFWDYKKLIDLTDSLGFSSCIPVYQGSSVAAPFTNINVFDTTEPHISFYVEIVK